MPRLAAEASTKVRPHPVTAHPTSGTPLGRTDKENKAIAFLFASAVVLFGLSRRAKRRAS